MDILNKLDPMPCGFGPAIKLAAKPTAAELREKELREFETKTDAPTWWFGMDFTEFRGRDLISTRQRLLDEICGIPPAFRASKAVGTTATEAQLNFFYNQSPLGARGK